MEWRNIQQSKMRLGSVDGALNTEKIISFVLQYLRYID